MQVLQLLTALLAAGDIDAAIRLEPELGRKLTKGELMKCAEKLMRWMAIITPNAQETGIGRTVRESKTMLETIALRLGDSRDQLYIAVCNEFLGWFKQQTGRSGYALLSSAVEWCRKVENERKRKRLGRQILALTIKHGSYYLYHNALFLAGAKRLPADNLQMLIMANYESHEIWGEGFKEQLGYCFRGLSSDQKNGLIVEVVSRLIDNGNLVIALRWVIPMLPVVLQAEQVSRTIAPIVERGGYFECMIETLRELKRPMTTEEFFIWTPPYLKRRDADPRVLRQAVADLPKADRDKANAVLAKCYYWWSEEGLTFARGIRSKRLKHQTLEHIFFGLLERGMHLSEGQRSGQYTYRDIATFSGELGSVHNKPRLRRLFREACSQSFQLEYAECMLPLFPPSERERAVERLVAAHILHHDDLCGRHDAIAISERLGTELRERYLRVIGVATADSDLIASA